MNYYLTMNFSTQIFQMKKIKKGSTRNFTGLFLNGYSYDNWLHNPNDKASNDSTLKDDVRKKLDDLTPPEGDEEKLKEEKRIKI